MNRRLASTVAALALIAGALPTVALASSPDALRVGGGAAPIENIFKRVKGPFEQKSGVRLVLRADGPDQAWLDLAAGKLDVATAGLSVKDWVQLMKARGHDIGNPDDYKPVVVGSDKIQVLTHKELAGVKSLSKAQLKDLFTGKTTNWKDVGGPDLPVVVVFGSKIPGTNKMWEERIMDGGAWPATKRDAGDAANIKKMVGAVPGAIGIGPLAADDAQTVHSPNTPEVARPITALTKGAPSAQVQKLYDYILGEGQGHVVK